jgi:hypothetical protein
VWENELTKLILDRTVRQYVENVLTTEIAQRSNHDHSFFATPQWSLSPKEQQSTYGEMLPPRTGLSTLSNILNSSLIRLLFLETVA